MIGPGSLHGPDDQWRIIFRWTDAGPADVSLVDYH
jgi:proteic killer suppression protein